MMPQVIFTAVFDPPLILPQNEWSRLFMFAGIPQPTMQLNSRGTPPTYDSLFFPIAPDSKADASEPRSLSRQRRLLVCDKDMKASQRCHTNMLYIYKPIYSQVLTEIPFSHPRQLVEMLPVLRQYAFLARLLEQSFGPHNAMAPGQPPHESTTKLAHAVDMMHDPDNISAFVHDFMAPVNSNTPGQGPVFCGSLSRMDVILWVHPAPHMQIVLPVVSPTIQISVSVMEGGRIEIVDENVCGPRLSKAHLAKALEVFEDLNKWAEWLWACISS